MCAAANIPSTKPLPTHCVWFKRDLRLTDHAALTGAAAAGAVLPLYIIEPEVIGADDFDAMHWTFIRESLQDLQNQLRDLGLELQIRHGRATEVLETLYREMAFEAIWAHQETGNAITFARDQAVAAWAAAKQIAFNECPQNGVVRGLRDRDGWAQHWEQRMSKPMQAIPPMQPAPKLTACALPTADQLGLTVSERQVDLKGGEREALRILNTFIQGRGRRYHKEMSSPNTAYESCSRLSPYLAWGCISIRQVVQTVRAAAGTSMPKMSARAFLSRCHWHCHFMQKLESEPGIEFHAFNPVCNSLRPREGHEDRLRAWQTGRTGYPFIDACMRALKAHGWINFRMRAMLVSFASYHLWLDWRQFKDWLACQFIDYEPGIHISQIQMQSGCTGINTLRIYNPVKQGQDHDPDGTFIRRWVPELRGVSTADIHEPWKMPELLQLETGFRMGEDYPWPVVDHTEAVRHARAAFSALRKQDEYWQASQDVLRKHGSRKSRENQNRPRRSKRQPGTQMEMDLHES
jgi:deoxyribodipyrimidine photo-lyase